MEESLKLAIQCREKRDSLFARVNAIRNELKEMHGESASILHRDYDNELVNFGHLVFDLMSPLIERPTLHLKVDLDTILDTIRCNTRKLSLSKQYKNMILTLLNTETDNFSSGSSSTSSSTIQKGSTSSYNAINQRKFSYGAEFSLFYEALARHSPDVVHNALFLV